MTQSRNKKTFIKTSIFEPKAGTLQDLKGVCPCFDLLHVYPGAGVLKKVKPSHVVQSHDHQNTSIAETKTLDLQR